MKQIFITYVHFVSDEVENLLLNHNVERVSIKKLDQLAKEKASGNIIMISDERICRFCYCEETVKGVVSLMRKLKKMGNKVYLIRDGGIVSNKEVETTGISYITRIPLDDWRDMPKI